MKVCTACCKEKLEDEFGKCKAKPDGLMIQCKVCYKEIRKEYSRNHREYNLEKINKKDKLWRKNNPWYVKHRSAKRRFLKRQGRLGNLFNKELNRIYRDCPEGYQVDHIVPLNHSDVCGLHVPWNLQYLTKTENVKKSNKLLTTYIDNATTPTVSSDITNEAANADCQFFNKQVLCP